MADEHRKDCIAFLQDAARYGMDKDYNSPFDAIDDITVSGGRLLNNERAVRIAKHGIKNTEAELRAAEETRAEILAELDNQDKTIEEVQRKLTSMRRIMQRPKRDISQWVFWALHTKDNVLDVTRQELHELDEPTSHDNNIAKKDEVENKEKPRLPCDPAREPSTTISANQEGEHKAAGGAKRNASVKIEDNLNDFITAGYSPLKRRRVVRRQEADENDDYQVLFTGPEIDRLVESANKKKT